MDSFLYYGAVGGVITLVNPAVPSAQSSPPYACAVPIMKARTKNENMLCNGQRMF